MGGTAAEGGGAGAATGTRGLRCVCWLSSEKERDGFLGCKPCGCEHAHLIEDTNDGLKPGGKIRGTRRRCGAVGTRAKHCFPYGASGLCAVCMYYLRLSDTQKTPAIGVSAYAYATMSKPPFDIRRKQGCRCVHKTRSRIHTAKLRHGTYHASLVVACLAVIVSVRASRGFSAQTMLLKVQGVCQIVQRAQRESDTGKEKGKSRPC